MCTEHQLPEMAGLHAGHLPILQAASPEQANLTASLHQALTENLNPHLPALPALLAMVEAYQHEDFGVLSEHRLVRLPLSVIGIDKVRYRTEVVDWLHETILSLRMSDITVEAIRSALRPHGLCILFMCSCGMALGRCEDVKAYYGTDEHRRMDRLRSAIDAEGNLVRNIDAFEDIKVPTMDLHANGAELRLFARIEELTRLASSVGHRDYGWLGAELRRFTLKAQPVSVAA